MKKFLSFILVIATLLTSIVALVACTDNGTTTGGTEINMNIDLSKKPTLNVLMPNSGKRVEEVNSDPTALLIEQLTGYKANYTQLPSDATTTLNTILMDKEKYDVMKLTKDQFADLVDHIAYFFLPFFLSSFAYSLFACSTTAFKSVTSGREKALTTK